MNRADLDPGDIARGDVARDRLNRSGIDKDAVRRRVLSGAGAGDAANEILAYCDSPFGLDTIRGTLPLAEEPHVADWRRYASAGTGVWTELRERLPQLKIPIRQGVSATAAYGQVIRRGLPFDESAFGATASLVAPDGLRIEIHEHPAGALPVLLPAAREDFETLYRALGCSSEPAAINPSVNAQMISGIVNWDRVAACREAWETTPAAREGTWAAEMARVVAASPERFYDRVILLGHGAYSGILAERLRLDMDDARWLERSTAIRLEHEFTHYATKRLFGAMRLNLFDELLADCLGMAYALGTFRARWFLLGLGLDNLPALDPRGRVHTYRGTLSERAFAVVCGMLPAAAGRVERLAARFYRRETRGRFLVALANLTLELLTAEEGDALFEDSYERAGRLERRELDRRFPAAAGEARS